MKSSLGAATALVLAWGTVSFAGNTGMISQQSQTAHYRLTLKIGPAQQVYSRPAAAKLHPTSGEIIAGGQTQQAMSGMSTDTRHLEVHVYSRASGTVVTTAKIAIAVVDGATGMRMAVPIAMMYGVKAGVSDWHYGNNMTMPPGAYDVTADANGEQATFHVIVPKK